ncbi:MFS efflux transporter aclA [Metarhizium anisopliae]|nr:MFS efflux transporter aclA [Metarhizium anisopliae]
MAAKDVDAEIQQPRPPGHGTSQQREAEVSKDTRVHHVDAPAKFQHTWRILTICAVLSLLTLNSGIDATVITTSLPTITREIGGASEYVWVAQSYLFACTIPQPLYGQIANIFGRRRPLFVAMALFAIGSGIAGGAHNVGMLICGRVIQGFGTGGINVLPEILICDLLPPRHRGPYLSVMLSTAALGSTIGPIIGGALAEVNWPWVFWLNLPVSGASALVIFFFLQVKTRRRQTWRAALARVDFLGNAIFMPSMTSLFFGLIMGGTPGYEWGSWRVVMPIVLGVVGWAVFHVHQASRFCAEPTMPPRIFKKSTAVMAFIIIFLASIIVQAVSTFLPIYFQAVKDATPLESGICFLAFAVALVVFGSVAAGTLSKTGKYKPLHWAGFATMTIGLGLFYTLDRDSGRGKRIGYQTIAACGAGFIFTASLPSALASLAEKDVATATSAFAFVRALGLVWGVTMSAIVFNGQVNHNLHYVDDANMRQLLTDGRAYTFTSGSENGDLSIAKLPEPTRGQVIHVYEDSLRVIWLMLVGIAGLGLVAASVLRHVDLRTNHQTEFGLSEAPGEGSSVSRTENGLVRGEGATVHDEKTAAK